MEFLLLGRLEVRDNTGALLLAAGRKQRVLLAVLLLHANQRVARDRLVDLLWGAVPPRSAVANLHTYVARLRTLLATGAQVGHRPGGCAGGAAPDRPSRLRAAGGGYALAVAPGELDLLRFECLVGEGRQALAGGHPAVAAERLTRALGLWRGRPLEDVPVPDDLAPALTELEDQRLTAVEDCVDARLALGEHAALAAEVRTLTEEHPLRERLWTQRMLAEYRAGRQSDALASYRQLYRTLADQLGICPGGPVQRLHQQILAGDPVLNPPPSTVTLSRHPVPQDNVTGTRPVRPVWTVGVPAELPAAVAAFTGRRDQLDQLERLFDRTRDSAVVAVISGMAGVGKTALAVNWCHHAADRFPHGQVFLDLGGFGAGRPVTAREALGRLLRALEMPAERVPSQQGDLVAAFRSAIAGRRMLIVLDNARGIEQVRPLLPGHAGSMVLVTSRDTMAGLVAVDGAYPIPLEPLAPAESLCLLNRIIADDRVRAERSAVTELARLCGHLPLALRLAAARLSTQPRHTVSSMVTRIRDHDRLASLWVPGDPRSAVRLAFDHSYLALDGSHRCLLRRLALPPGPDVTVPVTAALLDSTLDRAEPMLEALVAANLLDEHTPGRYRLHDLIRHYAAGRADREDGPLDREAAVRRVLAWYLHTADDASRILDPYRRRTVQVEPGVPNHWWLRFAGYAEALAWCEAERANLVAAVALAGERGLDELAWQFPVSLFSFFELRKYWQDWIFTHHIGLASARRTGTAAGEAWMLNSLGIAHKQLGRRDRAMRYHQQALALRRASGDRHGEAICSNNLGTIANETGRQEEAIAHYEHALTIFQESGDRWGEAMALSNLGECHRALDALDAAENCYRDALIIRRELDDHRGVGVVLHNIAETLYARGQHADAVVHYQQALGIRRKVGDRWGVARTLTNLGRALDETGDPAAARLCWRQALAIFRDLGDPQAPEVEYLLHARMSSIHAAGTATRRR